MTEASSAESLTKKEHDDTEFHCVEAFQCLIVVTVELLKCKQCLTLAITTCITSRNIFQNSWFTEDENL